MSFVLVRIEIPKGGRIKRSHDGRIAFVSPLGCRFNYGSVVGLPPGPDGDPPDAIVIGPALPMGAEVEAEVRGVVGFLDAGIPDDKLVAGPPVGPEEREAVLRFLRLYAAVKRAAQRIRGKSGETAVIGWRDP